MFNTFEEAKAAAIDVINRIYGGEKMDCVIVECKKSMRAKSVWYNFRFHDTDTNGEFVKASGGRYERKHSI